ncbi:DUF1598 domain-containing protein [Alienimonas californiensis]|uniref:DUF1598 domain-containing protein n=1 Tax=Alienimonas californiensis TaxID=2527989 RepID=A0A517P3J9_9PLAN|nr:DUF1598 domain-containing protein [Alienimonas californiensis]QDT13943.1 hypothetical protein CA12_00110 [Alienimonas californiensis]
MRRRPHRPAGVFLSLALVASPALAAENAADAVQAHLAAGEFGAAAELAVGNDALLAKIAVAQFEAGAQQAAARTLSRMTATRADGRPARPGSAARGDDSLAGGSMADFQPLIDLIQTTTGGLENGGGWEEIDGEGGSLEEYQSGVQVDPLGKMAALTVRERADRLAALGLAARAATLNDDLAAPSDLRLVSLRGLEAEVAQRLAEGRSLPGSMRHLAGLTQVQYVLLVEPTADQPGDILLGGPAAGWGTDEAGRVVTDEGRPVLHLDDLVTVLRTFSDAGSGIFQCLIVPRQEGLKAVKEYAEASQAAGPLSGPSATRQFVAGLGQALGEQDVVYNGVPADSRVARVIAEADYRMKLIGIDKVQGAGIQSYFDLLGASGNTSGVPMKALRWWLTTDFDAVLHSADRDVFELVGSRVLCKSEDEFINADGTRQQTGQSSAVNSQFAAEFTNKFQALAAEDPVFAELQNVFDLSLAAALISAESLDERAGWNGDVFANEALYPTETAAEIATVDTAVNHRVYRGGEVVVQVAGGVRGDLNRVLANSEVYKTGVRLQNKFDDGELERPAGRWWWDAAN